jgi:predicted ATP-grasp superfamily ATP-dependent carboligase
VTEGKRLARVLLAPDEIQDRSLRFSKTKELADFFGAFFDLRTRYFVFAWSDPKPALYDAAFALWRRFRSALGTRG